MGRLSPRQESSRAASSVAHGEPDGGRQRGLLPELVLACCLAFTAIVTWGILQASLRADRAHFGEAVAQAHQTVRERLTTHIAVLHATAGLFESHAVDRAGFVRFASRLRLKEEYPGIQGIGWSVRLKPGEGAAAGHAIWPGRDPEPHAIAFLHPEDRRNRVALGYNMFSDPIRREAMIRARETGVPSASRPVELVQEIDEAKQKGFLIYVPVYAGDDAPRSSAERRARFVGFAYGAFRAGDLFATTFGREGDAHNLRISVYDGPISPENLIYRSWNGPERKAQFRRVDTLPIAGRTWSIRYESTPQFEAASHRELAWLILALGVATSFVLYFAARALIRGRLAAEAAARRAEHEIEVRREAEAHQQLLINELNHRVKNTLATVQSIGAQTLRSAPDMTQARERYEARLIALSAAHNLLTSRRWEGADIVDIVADATAPFRTSATPSFVAEGPSLTLPPAKALALAMALHELATNAVKYGALSKLGGLVRLSWDVAPHGAVRVDWREEGGPRVAPPARSGFGTRLVERSLARDLGGTVTLTFRPEGVCCDIRFRLDDEGLAEAAE